ncbi:MAG: hypothetical protein ACYCWE_21045 [Eubacteriales bacterium]
MFKTNAIGKITREIKDIKVGPKEKAVSAPVFDTLIKFIDQDEEFAQAIVQSDKTFTDCLTAVMKGVGNSISDIEVYRRVVQFYFPGAGINFTMTINLCASVEGDALPGAPDQVQHKSKVLDINIDDLFG